MARADVLLVSLGSTAGLRAADAELRGALERAGARVAVAAAAPQRDVRTFALTDLVWARAARAAAARGARRARPARDHLLDDHGGAAVAARRARSATTRPPRPTVPAATGSGSARSSGGACARRRSSSRGPTARWPRRPRRTRPPSSCRSRSSRPPARRCRPPTATSPRSPTPRTRTRRASTGCSARGSALAARARSSSWRAPSTSRPPAGVRNAGGCARQDYRALVRRARVFVTAPRREDYGIAQLEALADGCALVTTAAPGPYAALPLARGARPALRAG